MADCALCKTPHKLSEDCPTGSELEIRLDEMDKGLSMTSEAIRKRRARAKDPEGYRLYMAQYMPEYREGKRRRK